MEQKSEPPLRAYVVYFTLTNVESDVSKRHSAGALNFREISTYAACLRPAVPLRGSSESDRAPCRYGLEMGKMKKLLIALAGVSALALSAGANAQQATITAGSSTLLIPSSNDFRTQLQGQGLAYFTDGAGANITLSGPSMLTFTYMGSESGFFDNFTATSLGGPITYQENSSGIENFWPAGITFGSGLFNGGSLAGLLNFGSLDAGALPAGLGDFGFGIFLPPAANALLGAQNPYTTNTFYIGYDDQATHPDDNHDDILIRVDVAAVPEPATWAMMLVGFGALGFAMRRKRSSALQQLA